MQDDYVKFIRFAQWRIEQTGYGILAFICNNAYLDNPTFRGMRQNLMQTFDDIYILDLHGNSKKKEKAPDGSEDKNVFDIQQGVAIGIFVKNTKSKAGLSVVHHADFWGTRNIKYKQLLELDRSSTNWAIINPQLPYYLLPPQDVSLQSEYSVFHSISDIINVYSDGIVTSRDSLDIGFTHSDVKNKFN